MFSAPEVSLSPQKMQRVFGLLSFTHKVESPFHSLHGVIHLLSLSICQGFLQSAQVERVWVLHSGCLNQM